MGKLAERVRNSFNYRVRGIKSTNVDRRTPWEKRRDEHNNRILESGGEFQYFEMLRELVTGSGNVPNRRKLLPLLTYALATRPCRMVELGCSFSYYPDTYPEGSPWLASSADDEGVFSTKVFLVACRVLNQMGICATLTSVDIREDPFFANTHRQLADLDLLKYWRPVMGTDSIAWLQSQTKPIDLCLVDSQHTYVQVKGELKALLPLMNPNGIIIIDDWWAVEYAPHVDWSPDDDHEGIRRGGEFGAILEFLDEHPEWKADWWPLASVGIVILHRNPAAQVE